MLEQVTQVLQFEVHERGRWAYILWPWTTIEDFLYDALDWGAKYKLRSPSKPSRQSWLEFVMTQGTYGEYRSGLYFGRTQWGHRIYRQFNARSSHSLAQHGLDGLPGKLWDAAFELSPGEPVGQVRIGFHFSTKRGGFDLTLYDWTSYFIGGRDAHVSDMGISIRTSQE